MRDVRHLKVQIQRMLRGLMTTKHHPLHEDLKAVKATRASIEGSPATAAMSGDARAKMLRHLDGQVGTVEAQLARRMQDKAEAKSAIRSMLGATAVGTGIVGVPAALSSMDSELPEDMNFKLSSWASGFMKKCAEAGLDAEVIVTEELKKMAGRGDMAIRGLKHLTRKPTAVKGTVSNAVKAQTKSLRNEANVGASEFPKSKVNDPLEAQLERWRASRPQPGAGSRKLEQQEFLPVRPDTNPVADAAWRNPRTSPAPDKPPRLTSIARPAIKTETNPVANAMWRNPEAKAPVAAPEVKKEAPKAKNVSAPKILTNKPVAPIVRAEPKPDHLKLIGKSLSDSGKKVGRGALTAGKAVAAGTALTGGAVGLSSAYDSLAERDNGMAQLAADNAKKMEAQYKSRIGNGNGVYMPTFSRYNYNNTDIGARLNMLEEKQKREINTLPTNDNQLPGRQELKVPSLLKASSVPGVDDALARYWSKTGQALPGSNFNKSLTPGAGYNNFGKNIVNKQTSVLNNKPVTGPGLKAQSLPMAKPMMNAGMPQNKPMTAIGQPSTPAPQPSMLQNIGNGITSGVKAVGNGINSGLSAVGLGAQPNQYGSEMTSKYNPDARIKPVNDFFNGTQRDGYGKPVDIHRTPSIGENFDPAQGPLPKDIEAKRKAFYEKEQADELASRNKYVADRQAEREAPLIAKEKAQEEYAKNMTAKDTSGFKPIVNDQAAPAMPVSAVANSAAPAGPETSIATNNEGQGAPVSMKRTGPNTDPSRGKGEAGTRIAAEQAGVSTRKPGTRQVGSTAGGTDIDPNTVIDHLGIQRNKEGRQRADEQFAKATKNINTRDAAPRVVQKAAPVKIVGKHDNIRPGGRISGGSRL